MAAFKGKARFDNIRMSITKNESIVPTVGWLPACLQGTEPVKKNKKTAVIRPSAANPACFLLIISINPSSS